MRLQNDLLSEDMRSSRPGISPWMFGREKSGRPPHEPTDTLARPRGRGRGDKTDVQVKRGRTRVEGNG